MLFRSLLNHHYDNINSQFDGVRYQKGACILHLLRQFIGDEAFRTSMKRYLEAFAYKSAEVDDWRQIIEDVTGIDMKPFFNVWYKSNISEAILTIALKNTAEASASADTSVQKNTYAISAKFCQSLSSESPAFQQYFQPGFKIKVQYQINGVKHQKEIPLGFCDQENSINVGDKMPTQIIVDPNVFLPLINIQYEFPKTQESQRFIELYNMFLEAEGYSSAAIQQKNLAIQKGNKTASFDFNAIPPKPMDPTTAVNLSVELKKLFWDRLLSIPENALLFKTQLNGMSNREYHDKRGKSDKEIHPKLKYVSPIDRDIMIDVAENLLASHQDFCVLSGTELLQTLWSGGPALIYTLENKNRQALNEEAFPYFTGGRFDTITYHRIRQIIFHQANNPVLRSQIQCKLLEHAMYSSKSDFPSQISIATNSEIGRAHV